MKSTTVLKSTFFVFVMVLMAVAFFTFKTFNQFKSDAGWVRHTNLVRYELEYIISLLKDMEMSQRGYALTADPAFLKPLTGREDTIRLHITLLDSLISNNPRQETNLDSLRKLTNRQIALTNLLLSEPDELLKDQENTMDLHTKSRINMDNLRVLVDEMQREENILSSTKDTRAVDRSADTAALVIVLTLLSLSALLYLFYYLLRAFNKKEEAEKIAHEQIKRKDEEAEVRRITEQQLKGVLNSSTNGIMSFVAVRDESNKIIDFECQMMNSMAATQTRTKKEGLINRRLLEMLPGNKTSGLFDKYCEVVETGKTLQTEAYYSYDGLDAWFFISAIKLLDGFVVTFHDITHQKQQTRQIEENEALLSEAEKLAQTGSWEWQVRTGNITWSRNAYKIYGLQSGEFTPTFENFKEYLHPDDRESIVKVMEESAGNQQPYQIEYRIVVNNEIKYIRANAGVKRDEHGNFEGFLGVIQDVSLQKEYEQLLITQKEELEKSNEELEQFAYVASHDLQEPLRKIRSFGDRLTTKYSNQLDDTARDYIARMQRASERMQNLIQDLLKFSRVSRNLEKFKPVDLNQVLEDVLTDLQISIENTNVAITHDPLPVINGNVTQLQQLFQNILSNAIKFRRENVPPEISVSTEKVTGKSLDFENINPAQKYYEISIKDNGIGFDDQYLDKIFSIFQRLHGRNEYEGTGIGLAICEKVVSNHQGYITAHGEKGKGAEFKIYLPFHSKYKKRKNAKTTNNYHFNG